MNQNNDKNIDQNDINIEFPTFDIEIKLQACRSQSKTITMNHLLTLDKKFDSISKPWTLKLNYRHRFDLKNSN